MISSSFLTTPLIFLIIPTKNIIHCSSIFRICLPPPSNHTSHPQNLLQILNYGPFIPQDESIIIIDLPIAIMIQFLKLSYWRSQDRWMANTLRIYYTNHSRVRGSQFSSFVLRPNLLQGAITGSSLGASPCSLTAHLPGRKRQSPILDLGYVY